MELTNSCQPSKANPTISAYKAAYNRHRRRPNNPLFDDDIKDNSIIDFSSTWKEDDRIISLVNSNHVASSYQGPIFGLASHPGFIFIPQALSQSLQTELAYRSMTEFCNVREGGHSTNIQLVSRKDSEVVNLEEDTMWNLCKRDYDNHKQPDPNVDPGGSGVKRKLTVKQSGRTKVQYYESFDKLSWATMGYQYDWTARAYLESRKSEIPSILQSLANIFAPFDTSCDNNKDTFTASAAIVNYYNQKSNMGGHADDLELDFTKPVISISLGLSAVFLLGQNTKDQEPIVPILVRPGDVLLLAGESRLAYHGMARVLDKRIDVTPASRPTMNEFQVQSLESILLEEGTGNNSSSGSDRKTTYPACDLDALNHFLSEHRININVRQVLPDGVTRIP
jgi:alkylated DNA repair protein alkB family protein 1